MSPSVTGGDAPRPRAARGMQAQTHGEDDMRNQSQETSMRGTSPDEEEPSSSPTAGEDALDFSMKKLQELAAEFSQETADAFLARASDLRQRALAGFERQRDRTADTLERLSRAFDFVGTEVQRQDESTARRLELA